MPSLLDFYKKWLCHFFIKIRFVLRLGCPI